MGNDLGFGAAKTGRKKLDLSGLGSPNIVPHDEAREEMAAERAANRTGFTSREPVERVLRQRRPKEPTDQVFVRAPISVINRFKAHCNETGVTYGDLIEDLMNRAGI